jgi:hypothetical protein
VVCNPSSCTSSMSNITSCPATPAAGVSTQYTWQELDQRARLYKSFGLRWGVCALFCHRQPGAGRKRSGEGEKLYPPDRARGAALSLRVHVRAMLLLLLLYRISNMLRHPML